MINACPFPIRLWLIIFSLGVFVCCGCALFRKPPLKPDAPLVRLAVKDYPDFTDGFFLDNLSHGIDKSLTYLEKIPAERVFRFGVDTYSAHHLMRSLQVLKNFVDTRPDASAIDRLIARHYRVYRSAGGPEKGRVLFTGYYEPETEGQPDTRCPLPLSDL